ncbi:hypothetical protein CIPAW_01G018100 [Carya illinoinensis]|uniref:Uncharacterized protein n=1 Tax=Carya illinoinensis TaxID=32201 RepID=A0A8T1RIU5_CARIL|nr:hypothetical protein CIPAW_01G018100 [Carya illinoinensis]
MILHHHNSVIYRQSNGLEQEGYTLGGTAATNAARPPALVSSQCSHSETTTVPPPSCIYHTPIIKFQTGFNQNLYRHSHEVSHFVQMWYMSTSGFSIKAFDFNVRYNTAHQNYLLSMLYIHVI